MLARTTKPTANFISLANYLLQGKTGQPSPSRVAWTIAQNLPCADPRLAAQLMTATAALSPRTMKPVYHLMIAFGLDEHPTPEMMQEIALRTLDLAGLGDHEALIMGHGDTRHAHAHLMINRVNPMTGEAWKVGNDWKRFDTIMRQLAGEHGFSFVPCHAFNPEETDHLPKRSNSPATYAGRRGAQTTRPQWSRESAREFGSHLSDKLDHGSGWDDLAFALAEEGLALEEKGSGFVIGDRNGYAKLSSLQLKVDTRSFGRRPLPAPSIFRMQAHQSNARNLFAVDAVDIVQAFAAWGLASSEEVRNAIAEADKLRQEHRQSLSFGAQTAHDLRNLILAATALAHSGNRKRLSKPQPKRDKGRDFATARCRQSS